MPTSAPRRSPQPAERHRDPERTRQKILDAATAEFAAHGYAGARIRAIADRAGVNQQLISYYFDGKEGLYQAMTRQWQQRQQELVPPGTPMPEQLRRYALEALRNPEGVRVFAWSGLQYTGPDPSRAGSEPSRAGSGISRTGSEPAGQDPTDPDRDRAQPDPAEPDPAGSDPDRAARSALFADSIAELRALQQAGRLPAELDPASLLVMLMAAAMATTTLPHVIEAVCGADPTSPEFLTHYAEQVATLARHI